jgi:hypothetical protein
MATKAQIRQRVGEDLGIVPIGQDLESHDVNRIDATFDEVYSRLKEKGLATWASTASIPTEVVPYYALMMEEKLLTSYSVPESRFLRIKNEAGKDGDDALNNISELITPEYESTDEVTGF